MAYLFDIKNGKMIPTTNLTIFLSYIAFFPSLVAGPIDKPKLLISQLESPRIFNYQQAADGLRQIIWGLFKKVAIANNAALIANIAFDTKGQYGVALLTGAFFYAIQIYADFSGYSDMALGIAKLIGFSITPNFNNPYFSQNIADFWRRWHISLTSWLTEYIFTPVSIYLRDYGKLGSILAILFTFIISGLWHGANWTFVVWGLLHGIYFIPLILMGRMNKKKLLPSDKNYLTIHQIFNMLGTFILVVLALILFRAESLRQALDFYIGIFKFYPYTAIKINFSVLFFTLIMFAVEWMQRNKNHGLDLSDIKYSVVRWSIYLNIAFAILFFLVTQDHNNTGFIYMKF